MRRLRYVVLAVAGLAAIVLGARPYVRGLSFVIRAADMHGTVRTIANLDASPEHEREITIPTSRGPMRARLYLPRGTHRRAALLTSGLHPSGIDEPRLVRLARELSADDVAIVTPDIPELSRFEITPAITDAIEQAADWIADQPDLAPDHRIGLMGISFSGGLSIVAAGRPSLAGKVAYVFSFGGHDDLPRVLRYLCTGVEPYPPGARLPPMLRTTDETKAAGVEVHLKADAAVPATAAAQSAGGSALRPETSNRPVLVRTPHDYGVAVMLLGVAERLVPPSQVEPLRVAVRRYLLASALDTNVDKAAAASEFDALRDLARRMPEPSATLLRYVNDRDVVHLGARLLPYIGAYGGAPALSPAKSAKPSVPVFLLHGSEDNVIPPIESEYLADELRGRAQVHLLLSGLISHAEADRPPHVSDVLDLAGFWGDLLSR